MFLLNGANNRREEAGNDNKRGVVNVTEIKRQGCCYE